MAIEYLSFPGNKIDVSAYSNKRREKIKPLDSYLGALKTELLNQAQEVNQEFRDFLDDNAQIKMIGFDAVSDAALVEQQEEAFSLEFKKSKEEWRKDKESQPANLTEIALTVLLHKFLKKDFIVARASAYDDYNNGVDQVIIDKKSGAIICGFDEVITPFKDGRAPKKEEKLKRKMQAGGIKIKYGAVVNNQGELERSSRSNLPAFYLALTKDELAELLPALTNDMEKNKADLILQKTFSSLSASLSEQLVNLKEEVNLNPRLQENLEKFQALLAGIKLMEAEFQE